MIKPTIHLNGTGKESLVEDYREAAEALQDAIEALNHNYPNGRDYYPQGTEAFGKAAREHDDRTKKVRQALDEVMELWEHVEDSGK